MRLVTYLHAGVETLGVVTDGVVRPATALGGPPTIEALLIGGEEALETLRRADLSIVEGEAVADVRLLAPLPRPANIVCIGRNYREHAAEEGVEAPLAPAIFLKHTSSITGPEAEIVWDADYTTQVDWEAELGAVIGTTARNVSVADALSHVLGYICVNDVSARDLQFGDAQWSRGKSLETFCPIGPEIVTRDEIADPQTLPIRCVVNGVVKQEANTADMYHSVAEIISYASHAFTLQPGDLIATGTPGGVGIFRDPPELLGDGDEVVIEVDGVGRLVNRCRTGGPGPAR
jgi:2-keto-4-pentenoate hydratase/2-oxohepta-3-ene-1,7-dioic acid hydratase in catechol pathway